MGNQALVDIREQIKAQLAVQRESISSTTAGRISTKGKMFTTPDGKASPGPIDCIILNYKYANRLYNGAFNPNKQAEMLCFGTGTSQEKMSPSPTIEQPVSESCSTCPNNQWGSSPTGAGKACQNRVVLAIVERNPTQNSEVLLIEGTATSLKSWDKYLKALTRNEMATFSVSTSISFNDDAAYPQLMYEVGQPLGDDELSTIFSLLEEAKKVLP